MKNSNEHTEPNTEFLLEEVDFPRYDYFLLNFRPAVAKSFYRMALLKGGKIKYSTLVSLDAQGQAVSLPGLPFGGIWSYEAPNPTSIAYFLDQIEKALFEKGAASLKIVQPPICYEKYSDIIGYFLKSSGYQLQALLNHQIFVGEKKIKKKASEYKAKFKPKMKQLGFTVTTGPFVNFDFLRDIKKWNSQRGYKITFSEEQLLLQLSEYPERFAVISVLQDEVAVGHAFAVQLTSNSLYYFLVATNPDMHHKITGDIIMTTLFELAADQKADFIDLGSSDLDGVPNLPLIFYKSKFANAFQNKTIWQKNLQR